MQVKMVLKMVLLPLLGGVISYSRYTTTATRALIRIHLRLLLIRGFHLALDRL